MGRHKKSASASSSLEVPRRRFFGHMLAGTLVSLCTPSISLAVQQTGKNSASPAGELIYKSAAELARLIRSRSVSSEEVVKAHLARIDKVNPLVNAVCQLDGEAALGAARAADAHLARGNVLGPLHGVPCTIKDSFDTEGIISAGGTTGRRQYLPSEDATAVARLKGAGAIVLGKTNTPELTLSYETDNLIYGKTNNPYDRTRTAGGSSGGAAAILALGGAPFDIGSDTAGSIRVPAHFCGVAGLKPTFGSISRGGHILPPGGVVGERTHVGPLARFVEDLVLLLPILSGEDWRDPGVVPVAPENPSDVQLNSLKLAFFTNNGKTPASSDVANAVRLATQAVAARGMETTESTLPGFAAADPILQVLNSGDGGDYYRKLLREYGTTQLHTNTAALLTNARSGVISGRKYSDVLMDWARLKEEALEFMEEFDLIICPPCSGTAPIHGGTYGIDFSYSYIFNLLGWPAAVVRVGTTGEGLPVGVQIVGAPWKDHQVLAAALAIEKALGGWKAPNL